MPMGMPEQKRVSMGCHAEGSEQQLVRREGKQGNPPRSADDGAQKDKPEKHFRKGPVFKQGSKFADDV